MWDTIKIHIDEEETINFSSHDVFEGFHAYKLHTLATIFPSNKTFKNPDILCLSSPQFVIIAIDSLVSVLSYDCQRILCKFTFDSVLDCINLSEDGCLLLVGERKGVLHVLNIPKQQKLMSRCLVAVNNQEGAKTFMSGFFIPVKDGYTQIVVTSKDNLISFFSHLNLEQLYKAYETGDKKLIQEVLSSLKFQQFSLSEVYHNFSVCNAFHMASLQNSMLLGIYGSGSLCLGLGVTEDGKFEASLPSHCLQGGQIRKVQASKSGRYLLVLDGQNNLSMICTLTLLILSVWKKMVVEDFVLVETIDPVSFTVTDSKIAMLIIPQITSEDSNNLQIRQFPSFELIYSVSVAPFARLIDTFANQEYVYVIEGITDMETYDFISALKLRAIKEEFPEMRLAKLLSKHRFEEAEKFACCFGLDEQIVYKAMMSSLLDSHKLQHLKDDDVQVTLEKLDSISSKIQETEFVIQCCLQANVPSLEIKRHFLLFARKTIEESAAQVEQKQQILDEINRTLHRLMTLQLAFMEEDVRYWYYFLTTDLLEEAIALLNSGKPLIAFFLWERHQSELATSLTNNKITEVLQAIPDNLESKDLVSFFSDTFLPCVLFKVSSALDIIAKWLIARVCKLEISEKASWPENGKNVLQAFLEVCNSQLHLHRKGGIGITPYLETHSLQRRAIDGSLPVTSLKNLISHLDGLSIQREIFGCYLPLSQFCQDDKMSVVFLILDRVLEKDIKRAVTQYLIPYMVQHNLKEDHVLLQYIQSVLQASPCNWWSWETAPWEEKLLILIDCIQNLDYKMTATIAVAYQASIPWSTSIKNLVDSSLLIDHPRKETLETQIKLVGLKKVLMKYKLLNYNISNSRKAELLMNYILNQQQPTALEDALKVVDVYGHISDVDVYLCHMRNLLKQQDFDGFSEVLSNLKPDKVRCCGERFLDFVCYFLECEYINIESERFNLQIFTMGAIHVLRVLCNLFPKTISQRNKLLQQFQRIYQLQSEFGVYISLNHLESSTFCWEILQQKIDCFACNDEVQNHDGLDDRNRQNYKQCYYHLCRLGELLGFCREKVIGHLALNAAYKGETSLAIDLCSELVLNYPSPETADSLLHLAKYFCSQISFMCDCGLDNKLYLFPVIHTLLSQAVAFCDLGILLHCTDLCQWTAFINKFISISGYDTSYFNNSHSVIDKRIDVYTTWKFSPLFKDQGMQVDISATLPLISKFLSINVLKDVSKESDDSTCPTNLKLNYDIIHTLVLILRGKGQEQAALGCLIKMSIASLSSFHHHNANTVSGSEVSYDLSDNIENSIQSMVSVLILRIVDQPSVDLPLAFGLISYLGRKKALAALKEMVKLSDYKYLRLMHIASVGLEYANVEQLASVILEYDDLHTRSYWGIKLTELHIPFRDAFSKSARQEKHLLLEKMVQHPKVTTKMLQDYCTAFVLDLDDALVVYLKSLLLSINGHHCSLDNFQSSHMIQKTLDTAEKVIAGIKNQELLLDTLKELVHKVDPYCYEILMFVQEQISTLSSSLHTSAGSIVEKGIELLKFLQLYTRTSVPSEKEVDMWLASNPDCDTIPSVATSRLPFNLLTGGQAWTFISPELTAKTAKKWLTVASLLKLPSDQLLMVAAKNSVTSWLAKFPVGQQCSWNYHIPDSSLLNSIRDIFLEISDPEMAIACASWVVKRLPPGDTKVLLAKASVQLAQYWMSQCENNRKVKDVVRKLTTLYQRLTAEQVLYKNSLDTSDAISLCREPLKLIDYLLSRVNKANIFEDSSKVHVAVKDIAAIIGCNLSEIYTSLLNKWLPPLQSSRYCVNESIILTDHTIGLQDYHSFDDEDEQNLQRVIFLLQHGSKETSVLELLHFGLGETDVNEIHQLRALRCLFSLVDSDTITAVSSYSSSDLWKRLRQLLYTTHLNALYLPYSSNVLDNCNKTELVEMILNFHAHDTKALMFVSSLCIEHKVCQLSVWSQIFQNMEYLSMVDNLSFLLQFLGTISHLWHSPAYIHAWNTLLMSPFKRGQTNTNEKYMQSYILLLRCPCFADINLVGLSEEFKQHNLLVPALGCLQLESDVMKRNLLVKDFCKSFSIHKIEEQLCSLKDQGINPVYFSQVKSAIYSHTMH